MALFIHATAEVEPTAEIGENTRVWAFAQVREFARIGENCIIGRNVLIDRGVILGNNCKVQNNALLYGGVVLESGVFVGPAACFTNDKNPRAVNPDGTLKGAGDWVPGKTLVKNGASVGAQAVIVTNITLGNFCLVGSGAVVTKDVPDFGLVIGSPARLVGYVCRCATKLIFTNENKTRFSCPKCNRSYKLEKLRLIEV